MLEVEVSLTDRKEPKLTITVDDQVRIKVNKSWPRTDRTYAVITLCLTASRFIRMNPNRTLTLRGSLRTHNDSIWLNSSGKWPTEKHLVDIAWAK